MDAPEINGRELLKTILPKRKDETHKGDYGRLGMLCGSVGLTGAPYFAANSAVRAGAGLVTVAVPRDIYQIVAVKLNEAMPFPIACDGAGMAAEEAIPEIIRVFKVSNACLAGCGLGRSVGIKRIMEALVKELNAPLVLDADGINAFSGHIKLIRNSSCPIVLTLTTEFSGLSVIANSSGRARRGRTPQSALLPN